MKLKVCGMRDRENILELALLNPDYIGFIFYKNSPRFAGNILDSDTLNSIPSNINKVGVFVNSEIDFIIENASKYNIEWLQLQGDESAEYCARLKNNGFKIIKAFAIGESFDFIKLQKYDNNCDYYLFDAKGKMPGGNSRKFDWKLLGKYNNSKPFFLSGGIDLKSLKQIECLPQKMKGLNLHAIDVNSKFEIEPGLKDVIKIEQLINKLRNKAL